MTDEAGYRFSVLGPVRAWRGGAEVELGPPQQQALLAVLLVRAGQPVMMTDIIDVIWGENPPSTVVNVVQRYISRLRRMLPADALARCSGGYRLDLDNSEVDLLTFRRLRDGSAAVAPDDSRRALDLLIEALGLWHGHAAASVHPAIRAAPMFTEVDGEFVAAVLRAADLALTNGESDRVLPVLRAAAAVAPFDETLQAALLRALAATGRPAEALTHYDGVRRRLADELGVDPGPLLSATHQEILRAEPTATVTQGGRTPATPRADAADGPAPVRPAQVPADLPTFAGRTGSLARITDFLTTDPSATARVVAVSGMGGIGKTTLAVRCAHRLAADFPDGQLYVNMRAFDPSGIALRPQDAIRSFLDALGIAEEKLPAGIDAQVALYRSLIAGRRMVVVIDNVRDAQSARPLLPGAPGSAAIVTSRDALTGLVVQEGALPVPLDLLSGAEAEAVLAHRLGPARLAAEPEAVREAVRFCGGIPLALAIFAARAAIHPQFTLRHLVAELATHRLDSFGQADADHDLRAVFSWSYELLGEPAARLFRLLAVHPGHQFGVAAAASLLGTDSARGRMLLGELSRANLLTEYEPGRFRIHDLVRAYSAELVHLDGLGAQRDASQRLLDHYLLSSFAALALLDPERVSRPKSPRPQPVPDVTAESFRERRPALAWLTNERRTLLAMIDLAVSLGADTHVWPLAWALESMVRSYEYWSDWEATQHHALAAARRLNNVTLQAGAHYSLGYLYCGVMLNEPEKAERHLLEAIRLFAVAGDPLTQAHAHLALARHWHGQSTERAQHERALALYQGVESDRPGTVPPDYLAYVYERLGRYDAALDYALRAVRHLDQAGNYREATAWHTLANIRIGRGELDEALAANDRAVHLYRTMGDEYAAALLLELFGDRLAEAGQVREAHASLGRALQIFERLRNPRTDTVRETLRRLAGEPAVKVSA
ncbi:BTAD domain-containing putative transcriptional regulator [Micromonospora sp. WMMD1082]|uniref:AfsR/SARP family transcriptional regulator n=1 Tax=Micromonospora sp. WMMD1082 TaxID=3016104 RepID=UPI002417FA6E|nr:BTAD domain-containing putative transcriptional regulator [Micromonospora sp. WMMD1082]MDG4795743.1 BTAD domain-containing putative transcriptional regulator [Micromonospora sp. WMMD1082]